MKDVAVIGAGVAGIQAALDLADHGVHVHLIEREPGIGGHMAQLDKTFPTNDCSMCILSPKLVDVVRHPRITIHTMSEVECIEGEVGNFTVHILKHPRFVDEELCNGCGDCVEVCPVEVYNRFDAGIGVRKAIYKAHPQVIPDVVVRDDVHCIDCGLCYDVCGRDAILKEERERALTLEVASIVVSTGFDIFNACGKPQLSYLAVPDVITSLELERMINASGPTAGTLSRLSDGKIPRSVVFIQCVGSRDASVDRPWCSCVCCMYAIKNAILIKEKDPSTDVTICYMDIRAYGKGYQEFYDRAEAMGIRFLRGLPGEVREGHDSLDLPVEDTETGKIHLLHPDLVVLSVGMEPPADLKALAGALGIEGDGNGFLGGPDPKLDPVATIKPGIYIAGAVNAPKDIPDSVAQGEAAAMRAFTDAIRSA
ncbi:MAG: CoB--CoM heterodisulfide reductase iron-sulfur subunit A family protein [Methanomicrobiaceae archaeon]|nr:CoB--CoM heterodisulfide reductase iron-sulfur subunit A family protein [Methanomicrobiaceae archaeon]